jgi:hypothetical protein
MNANNRTAGPGRFDMKKAIAAIAMMLVFACIDAAAAQTFPARPITMIVPFAAGGPTDVTARILGEHMSRTLGQQIVIENVLGAGGTTGSARIMRSSPDGYTIGMGQIGTLSVAPALYPNLPYRPDVDFAPIGLVVDQAVLIVARRNFPANDLKEFVTYLKANSENRFDLALHLPVVQQGGWRQAGAGAVQRRIAGRQRVGRQSGRLYVRADFGCRRTGPVRHHEGLCHRHRGAQRGTA